MIVTPIRSLDSTYARTTSMQMSMRKQIALAASTSGIRGFKKEMRCWYGSLEVHEALGLISRGAHGDTNTSGVCDHHEHANTEEKALCAYRANKGANDGAIG
jgi:hypothetical protein